MTALIVPMEFQLVKVYYIALPRQGAVSVWETKFVTLYIIFISCC